MLEIPSTLLDEELNISFTSVLTGSSTHMGLAMLEEHAGIVEKIVIAEHLQNLIGESLFPIPALFSNDTELFVSIDLVSWMTGLALDQEAVSIDFFEGRSEVLPGWLVSGSLNSFDPSIGFISDMPFEGSAQLSAGIIKQAPEPSSLFLLVGGLIYLCLVLVRNPRRNTKYKT